MRLTKLITAGGLAACLAAPVFAQTSDHPTGNGVLQTFNNGAYRVGRGASQIGEGIKLGAILTWHAMQNGAHSVAQTFNGRGDARDN